MPSAASPGSPMSGAETNVLMAHMWFGTCVGRSLWLNESFRHPFDARCQPCEGHRNFFLEAWTTFATVEKSLGYRHQRRRRTDRAADIPDLAAVEVNLDGITYYWLGVVPLPTSAGALAGLRGLLPHARFLQCQF